MKTPHSFKICMAIVMIVGLAWSCDSLEAAVEQSSAGSPANAPLKAVSDEQIDERVNQLIERINSSHAAFQRYKNVLKNASKEDKLVIELQIWALQQRVIDESHQLADELVKLEKKSPQPELRQQIEAIFSRILERFQFHAHRLRNEIDQVRAGRTEAAADQRFKLEATVARLTSRLDDLMDMYLRHVQKMEQLHMDVEKARSDLVHLLTERADELSGRIALSLSRINSLEERRKEIPDDAEAATLLAATVKGMDTNAASLEATLALMDGLNLPTEALRAQLVSATHDYSSGLTDTGVVIDMATRTLKNITGWLAENGPKYLLKVLLVVAIIFIFRYATRFVRKALDKAIESSKLDISQLAKRMIVNTSANLVMLFGLMLALSQLGISLGPLLAGLGVAGFIVGFALQDTLGNFASGMMILLYRPFDVGDLVEVSGMLGKVDKMSLVSTILLTVDNQLIVIPNNKIWGDVIKNVTAQTVRRVDMVFGISYSDDIPKAERIFEDILKSHEKVLDDPAPMVRLHALGASSVDFIVRPWVNVDDYWDVYWDVTRTVKLRFDEEGVSIPFPQRDVHVYHENPPSQAIALSNPETASG